MAGLGLFGLCTNKKTRKDFWKYFFLGTKYQQHNGEEAGGLSLVTKEGKIKNASWKGLFSENEFKQSESTHGISFCGGPPSGPREKLCSWGKFSMLKSGKMLGKNQELNKLLEKNTVLSKEDELEIYAHLLGSGASLIEGVKKLASIKGGQNILFVTKNELFAFRGSKGRFPLVVGKKDGIRVVASDPSGFENMGLKIEFEIRPGELIKICSDDCKAERILKFNAGKEKTCSFLWIYTAFPTGSFRKKHVREVREKLGAALAVKDFKKGIIPDIVTPVPDSGRFHAQGYFKKMKELTDGNVTYQEVLLKWGSAGRSFTKSNYKKRRAVAKSKLLPDGGDFTGKSIAVLDDSIVRGTQMKTNLVPKLKKMNFSEIHIRISCPPLYSHCKWSDSTKKGELFTSKVSPSKMSKDLNVDSLRFNDIKTLISSIGLKRESLCIDCLKK